MAHRAMSQESCNRSILGVLEMDLRLTKIDKMFLWMIAARGDSEAASDVPVLQTSIWFLMASCIFSSKDTRRRALVTVPSPADLERLGRPGRPMRGFLAGVDATDSASAQAISARLACAGHVVFLHKSNMRRVTIVAVTEADKRIFKFESLYYTYSVYCTTQ